MLEITQRQLELIDGRQQDGGIHRIPKWPANSPDLNEIEPCWNYLKDSMAEYEFIGSSQSTQEEAARALSLERDCMPQELIDRFCMNFHLNLQQVRAWGEDNKFNALFCFPTPARDFHVSTSWRGSTSMLNDLVDSS